MATRWPETIIQDPTLERWFEEHLFNDDGWFNPAIFEDSATLYKCEMTESLLEFLVFGDPKPAPFSRAELNDAIKHGCEVSSFHPAAWWFHVNVHDGIARVVERIGKYSFRYPLEPVMMLVSYHSANEGGPTYTGLLDCEKRWCLLLEKNNGFEINLYGPAAFCDAVRHALGGNIK